MKKSVAIFIALTLILNLSFFAAAETVESADASTMRLARTEGGVSLKDESGTELSYRENMRLYSGNTVATEAAIARSPPAMATAKYSGRLLNISYSSLPVILSKVYPYEGTK